MICGGHKWGLSGNTHTFGQQNLDELKERFHHDDEPWIDEPCILKAGQASFHHALTRMSHKFEKRCEARQSEIRDGSVLATVPIWDI